MSIIHPAFYMLLLIAVMLAGVVLSAVGIVLLIKLKDKLVGALTTAVGAGLTFLTVTVLFLLTITRIVPG